MQPRTKRKKAETRVKSSTCCERTAAPMLGKNQHCVREQGKEDSLQSLEDTEGTKSKSRTKHREKAIKEGGWPANLRKEKHDNLEDDKQAVDDGPENAANLVGYSAVPVTNVSKR
jgi:hypothetical protein